MRSGSLLVAVCLTAAAPLTAQDPAERKTFTLPHVLEVVGQAIDQPVPAGLSAADQRAWAAQTEWLSSVRSRLEAYGVKTGAIAPRDAASGQATGKRVAAPRDAASGQATGKRVAAPRDAASGQATGKRVAAPRDAASGQATGKRVAAPGDSTGTDGELETLRQGIEREGQKYTTLSNVMKTRHDVAMNAIRNLKG